jgi:hypothetical protein
MDYVLAVLQSCIVGILVFLGFYFKKYLHSYVLEKGKNLAQIEDIRKITDEVEKARIVYSSQIELLKEELQRDLEGLKHQLTLVAQEHQIQFAKLHEKRAEVVVELYFLMEDANIHMRLFARVLELKGKGKSTAEKVNHWHNTTKEKCQKLFDFARRNKLYFGEATAGMIEHLVFSIQEPSLMFGIVGGIPSDECESDDNYGADIVDRWAENSAAITKTMKIIEREFRQLLGVRGSLTVVPETNVSSVK